MIAVGEATQQGVVEACRERQRGEVKASRVAQPGVVEAVRVAARWRSEV